MQHHLHSGHIRARKNKSGTTHQVIVEFPPDALTGKRNTRVVDRATTKKEAEAILAKTLSDLNANTYIGQSTAVLKPYMQEWLEIYVKPHTTATTHFNYEMQIKNHIFPALGNMRVQDIKSSDLQKLYNRLHTEKSPVSGKTLAPKTIKNIHNNLRACLTRAVKDDIIRRNPADDVILPKARKTEINIYNREETAQLLEAVRDTNMELIVNLLIA